MISITVTAAAKTSRCTKTTSPLNNLNISPEIKGRHYSSARPRPNEWTISTIFSNQLISCSVKWKTKVLINLFVMEITYTILRMLSACQRNLFSLYKILTCAQAPSPYTHETGDNNFDQRLTLR